MAIPLDKFYEGRIGTRSRKGTAWEVPWTILRRDQGAVVAQGVGRGETPREAENDAWRSIHLRKRAKPADWLG